MSIKLIVGLGNPGKEYSSNRHNIGFLCLNHFAKKHRIEFDKKQSKARVGTGRVAGYEVVLAKPQTYMNASGESVAGLVRKYSLNLDDMVIIHDDLDLPLGKIRIRAGNSAGGHNGIESIIFSLGRQDFIRIRVGIGRPLTPEGTNDRQVVDYVLGDFSSQEKEILEETIGRVSEAVLDLLTKGLAAAMNSYN
jgi:peptidyl-tRNA hydrolase, PTH1 family